MSYKKNKMTTKIIIVNLLLVLTSCAKSQNIKNPENICKDCGSFDVNKIEFTEKIDKLILKGRVFITAIDNYNVEKRINEISKKDIVIAYKYKIVNRLNEDLGEGFFKFNNVFNFDNLSFLVDSEKKIIAYKTYSWSNNGGKKTNDLIEYISEISRSKAQYNILYADGSNVYQWDSMDYFYQLMSTKDASYTSLLVIKKNRFTDSIKKAVKNDETFLLFNEKSFKKWHQKIF